MGGLVSESLELMAEGVVGRWCWMGEDLVELGKEGEGGLTTCGETGMGERFREAKLTPTVGSELSE